MESPACQATLNNAVSAAHKLCAREAPAGYVWQGDVKHVVHHNELVDDLIHVALLERCCVCRSQAVHQGGTCWVCVAGRCRTCSPPQ